VGYSLCLDLTSYIRYVAGGGWMTGVSIRRSFLLSNFLNTARHRITNRQQVFDLGIGRYNETCHNIVTKYISEWEAMVTRARRWIDFKNDYKTMDLNFM
jgi:acyl-CoA oxidase